MAERGQLPGPVMAAAAGLHGDLGAGKLREEGDHLAAVEINAKDRPLGLVDAMQGEHGFGRVDGNAFILGHGRLRSWMVDNTQFWHAMPWGRPPQQAPAGHPRLC